MKHFSFFTNGSMKEHRLIFMAEMPDAQPNPEAEAKRLQEENKLLREQLDTTNKNLDKVMKMHEEVLKKIDTSPYLPRQDASGVPYIPALERSPMMSSPAARNVMQQQLRMRNPNMRNNLRVYQLPYPTNNNYSPRMRRAPRQQVIYPDRKNYDGQRRQFFTVPRDEYGEPIRLPNGEYARVYGETVGDVAARLRATQPMMQSDSDSLRVLARYNRNRGSYNEGVYRFKPYEPIGGVKLPSETDRAWMGGVNNALGRGLVPMGGNYYENPNLVRGRTDKNGNWYDAGPQFREQFSARTGWKEGETFQMGLDENNEITYYPVEASDASMIGMNSIPAARGSRSEQDQIRSFNAGLDKEKIETGYEDLAKSNNPDVKRVYGEVMQRLSENMRKYSGDRREIESQYQLARTRLDQLRKNAFEMNSNAEVQGKALRTVERGVTKFAGDSYFTIEYEEAGTLKKITIRDPRIWGIGMFVGPESMDLAKEQGIRVSQKTLSTGKVNGLKIDFTKPGSFKLTSVNGSSSQPGTEVIDIKPAEVASTPSVPKQEYSPPPVKPPEGPLPPPVAPEKNQMMELAKGIGARTISFDKEVDPKTMNKAINESGLSLIAAYKAINKSDALNGYEIRFTLQNVPVDSGVDKDKKIIALPLKEGDQKATYEAIIKSALI